jgi:multisubunit Na+/H+ antiporter MnhE subunit
MLALMIERDRRASTRMPAREIMGLRERVGAWRLSMRNAASDMRLSWMLDRTMAGLLGLLMSTGALALVSHTRCPHPQSMASPSAWPPDERGSHIASMGASVDKQTRRRRHAGGMLLLPAWWMLLGGLWMLLVDTLSTAEVLCAVAVGLAGMLVTRLAFESEIARMRPVGGLAAVLVRQLLRVPGDLLLLARELIWALAGRRRAGRFHDIAIEIPLDRSGSGRRAAIELFGSLAPNTIVLGVDERRVAAHQLVARHEERSSLREIGS